MRSSFCRLHMLVCGYVYNYTCTLTIIMRVTFPRARYVIGSEKMEKVELGSLIFYADGTRRYESCEKTHTYVLVRGYLENLENRPSALSNMEINELRIYE